MTLPISGLCTLRATTRPSCSTARCTWEIDAEATGFSSMEAKISATGRRYSSAQDRLDFLEWKAPHIVAQRGQLVCVGLGQKIGPCAEQLA